MSVGPWEKNIRLWNTAFYSADNILNYLNAMIDQIKLSQPHWMIKLSHSLFLYLISLMTFISPAVRIQVVFLFDVYKITNKFMEFH